MPQTLYTQEEYETQERMLTGAMNILNDIFRIKEQQIRPLSVKKDFRKEGGYNFIPYGYLTDLLYKLKTAKKVFVEKNKTKRYYAPSFLDCGCGIGNIMRLASRCASLNSYGVEIDPDAIKYAKDLFNYTKVHGNTKIKTRKDLENNSYDENKIFEDNLLTFDKYKLFDILYMYVPIQGEAGIKFEEKLYNDMRKNSILLAVSSNTSPVEYGLKKLEGHIFIKK